MGLLRREAGACITDECTPTFFFDSVKLNSGEQVWILCNDNHIIKLENGKTLTLYTDEGRRAFRSAGILWAHYAIVVTDEGPFDNKERLVDVRLLDAEDKPVGLTRFIRHELRPVVDSLWGNRKTGKQEVRIGSDSHYFSFPNKFLREDHGSIPFFLGKARGRHFWIFQGIVYSAIVDLKIDEFKALLQEAENKVKAKVARAVALAEQVQAIEEGGREPISDDVKIFVWQRDQGRCVKCGSNKNLEFDHIIPSSMGGAGTARNLQLLCESCNRAKGGSLV